MAARASALNGQPTIAGAARTTRPEAGGRSVVALSDYPLTRILSSPYDRCVETVEPLAQARGLEIEIHDESRRNTNSRRAWSSHVRCSIRMSRPAVTVG